MDDANRGGAGDVSQQTISQFSDAECSDDDGDELDPRVQVIYHPYLCVTYSDDDIPI